MRFALAAIPSDDCDIWVRIGLALFSFGLEGTFALWDEWSASQGYPDYGPSACKQKWKSFRNRPVRA